MLALWFTGKLSTTSRWMSARTDKKQNTGLENRWLGVHKIFLNVILYCKSIEKLLCIIISSLFLIWSQNIIHLTKDAPLWNLLLLLEVYPGKSSFECLQCIHINLSHWNQEAFSYVGISTAKKNRGIEKNAGEKIRVCEYDTETASLTSSSIWEHRVIDAYSAGKSYSHAMKNYTFWFFRFGIFLALKCFRSSELDILKLRGFF